MASSHPGSSRYGKHYTAEEVHDLFAPSQESVDSVRDWLESMGIAGHRVSQSVNKQWLQFDAEAQEVENLLRTEYYLYSHQGTGKSHIACQEYVYHSIIWKRREDRRLIRQVPCPQACAETRRHDKAWYQLGGSQRIAQGQRC